MAYVGREPRHGFLEGQTSTFNGSTTTVTLQRNVSSTDAIDVYIDNVHQEPDVAYTLSSGGDSITFTGTPENGAKLYVRFHGITFDTARANRLINTDGGSTATLADNDTFTMSLDGTTVISATSSGVTIPNLTVTGTTTSVNSTNLEIGDNKITLNSDVASNAAPSENAGITINRGSSADVDFIWNETNDEWYAADDLATGGIFRVKGGGTTPTLSGSTLAAFTRSAATNNASIAIIGNSGGYSSVHFGDENDEDVGQLNYSHTADTFALNKGLGVTGNITVSGTVDGADIAALNTNALLKTGGTMTGNLEVPKLGIGAAPASGYGDFQLRGSFAYINEDSSNTKQLYLRSDLGGDGPAIQVATAHPLRLVTNNVWRLEVQSTGDVNLNSGTNLKLNGTTVIDSSQNIGVGVAPDTRWTSTYPHIDLDTGGAVYGTSNGVSLAANLYFDGSNWKNKVGGSGGNLMANYNGGYYFYKTTSQTNADTTVTLSERLRVDDNVDLRNGTALQVGGTTVIDSSRNIKAPYAKLGSASHQTWTDSADDIGGVDIFVGSGSHALTVWDDNVQSRPRFIVERGGNVGVNVSAPLANLHVQGNAIIGDIQGYETTHPGNSGATLHIHDTVSDGADNDGRVNFGDETKLVISTGAEDGGGQGYQGSLWFGTSDHPAGGSTLNQGTQFNYYVAGIASKTDNDTGSANVSYGNLEFYTKGADNTSSPALAMSIGETQNVDITSGDLKVGGTTVIDSSRTVNNVNISRLNASSIASVYVSPQNPNTFNGGYDQDIDTADLWLNYRGYVDGFSRFRDTRIGDGKGTALLHVDGSTKEFAYESGSSIKLKRSDNVRSSSLFHNNDGLTIQNNNSGDNIYIKNTSNSVYVQAGTANWTFPTNSKKIYYNPTGSTTNRMYLDQAYEATVNCNRAYTHICNVTNGSGYTSAFEFTVSGTTNNTVAYANGIIAAGHSADGSIVTLSKLFYTGVKIKMVTDGNNQISFYIAVNSHNNATTAMHCTIKPLQSESVQFAADGATAYSSKYLEHEAATLTSSVSGTMSSGTGPANGY